MLYVNVLKRPPKDDYVWSIDGFFRLNVTNDWMNTDVVRKIVMDIDHTEVIKDGCLKSPVLGYISPHDLSGGAKTLICMAMLSEKHFYKGALMGENCYPTLLELSKTKDIYLHMDYSPYELPWEFEAIFLDTSTHTYNRKEFRDEYYKLFHQIKLS